MTNTQQILKDLAKAKAVFQLRAIVAAMGIEPDSDAIQCSTCGDHHDGAVPYSCQTGDGE